MSTAMNKLQTNFGDFTLDSGLFTVSNASRRRVMSCLEGVYDEESDTFLTSNIEEYGENYNLDGVKLSIIRNRLFIECMMMNDDCECETTILYGVDTFTYLRVLNAINTSKGGVRVVSH